MKKVLKKIFEDTYSKKRKEKIIFVLSTGRCGSTSITKMFNQHPGFLSFHEEMPELIRLSTELAELPEEKERIYKELRNLFKNKKWEAKKGQIPVHSDHRLWNFVGFLNDFFPNAYFIHLIRNPLDSVKSFIPRNWYTDLDSGDKNIYAKYRLHANKIGEIPDDQWLEMNQIDKCVWYWNYVNNKIFYQLKILSEKKHSLIQLEEFTLGMNNKIKDNFRLEKNFYFKNHICNESKDIIEPNRNIAENFQESLYNYGKETTERFYPANFVNNKNGKKNKK